MQFYVCCKVTLRTLKSTIHIFGLSYLHFFLHAILSRQKNVTWRYNDQKINTLHFLSPLPSSHRMVYVCQVQTLISILRNSRLIILMSPDKLDGTGCQMKSGWQASGALWQATVNRDWWGAHMAGRSATQGTVWHIKYMPGDRQPYLYVAYPCTGPTTSSSGSHLVATFLSQIQTVEDKRIRGFSWVQRCRYKHN